MKKILISLIITISLAAFGSWTNPVSATTPGTACSTLNATDIYCFAASTCPAGFAQAAVQCQATTTQGVYQWNTTGGASTCSTCGGSSGTSGSVDIRRPDVANRIPTELSPIVNALISLIFIVGFLIAFFFLVLGGVQWIMSGGDKQATQAARDKITAALVGVAIIAFSFALIIVLERFFGIHVLNFQIPTTAQ